MMNPNAIIPIFFIFLIIISFVNEDELDTTNEYDCSTSDSVTSKLDFSCNDLFDDFEGFICEDDDDVSVKNMK